MDEDLLLAIRLQEQFDREDREHRDSDRIQEAGKTRRLEAERPLSIVDASWEVLDPNPDVRALFLEFNQRFFWGKLSGVEVKWSPRMTLCAGVCSYEGRGGLCSIRLSEPLLKLRPRKDLVETLLHEMIHALLFVTQNNRDRDGHGPEFCKHMDRINQASGTRITVYHSFHDEVDVYRQHWWRCDGPCRTRRPYYGWVKRAMNRAPSRLDPWWEEHRLTCGGSYTKVKEPEGYSSKKGKKKEEGKTEEKKDKAGRKTSTTGSGSQDIRNVLPFSGKGFVLGGNSPSFRTPSSSFVSSSSSSSSPSPSGGRPLTKTSVGNTRAFVNINGSPVKIPKAQRGSGATADRSQKSIEDLFRSPASRPGATRDSSVATKVSSSQVKFSPDRTRQKSIAELFRNPASQPDAKDRSTAPPRVSSPGQPPSSPAGPAQSRYFGDSPGGAASGAKAGGSASRKRSWDQANVSDFFHSASDGQSRDSISTPASSSSSSSSLMVSCPVCQVKVQESEINAHLDSCLS